MASEKDEALQIIRALGMNWITSPIDAPKRDVYIVLDANYPNIQVAFIFKSWRIVLVYARMWQIAEEIMEEMSLMEIGVRTSTRIVNSIDDLSFRANDPEVVQEAERRYAARYSDK